MTIGQDRYHKLISSLRVSKFVLTKIKQEVSRTVSLMDVEQNLIFITSYYVYFKLLMILFSI